MPAKPIPKAATKLPDPPGKLAATSDPKNRVSRGLLSLIVGSIALSFNSIPFLRIFSVLLSLVGLSLAILEFRSSSKVAHSFGRAIAGALLCVLILVVTAVRPYWSARAAPIAQASAAGNSPQTTISAQPLVANAPQTTTNPTETTSGAPQTASSVPQTIPFQTIPFPCGKHLKLVPIPIAIEQTNKTIDTGKINEKGEPIKIPKPVEWVDADSAAVQQDDVCVCVASATIERLKLASGGKTNASPNDNLVIRLQVVLVGTTRKVDFASWGNASFGDARNKPSLADNFNNVYRHQAFGGGTEIVEHERPKSLYPKLFADDYLIFEVPKGNVDFLRLELPASAIGGMGTLRFQIPKSMIEQKKAD